MIQSLTRPILNPVQLPTALLPAEMKFARCLCEGVPCELGKVRPNWPIWSSAQSNVIRAEVIRFFVYGGDENHPVKGTRHFLVGCMDFLMFWI